VDFEISLVLAALTSWSVFIEENGLFVVVIELVEMVTHYSEREASSESSYLLASDKPSKLSELRSLSLQMTIAEHSGSLGYSGLLKCELSSTISLPSLPNNFVSLY